jgi:GT2 family glycosyltransferase
MYSPGTLLEEVGLSIVETMRSVADPECEVLLRQAAIALGEDVPARSLATLEAVQMRRPSDSLVTLAIGLLRILAGDPRATEPLELIADRYDDRKTMLYLILARLIFGATRHAAADLGRLLQRHTPSFSPDALAVCDRVAAESGAPGWCGLSSAGVLVVSIVEGAGSGDKIAVRRDGVDLSVSVRKDSHRALYTVGAVEGWLRAQRIEVSLDGAPLIGSAIDVSWITRMEGFVATDTGGLSGWCWFPSDPDRKPSVTAVNHSDRAQYLPLEMASQSLAGHASNAFATPWRFAAGREQLASIKGLADILGPSGRPLYGSPIDPMNFINSARSIMHHVAARFPRRLDRLTEGESLTCYEAGVPVSAATGAPRPVAQYRTPKVAVVIPVYRGFAATMNCVRSVFEAEGIKPRIIVVVDASPDKLLVNELKALAVSGKIELHIQTVNRGFPATANIGLRLTDEEDVILLNSDTFVPQRWIDRLQEAVYQADDIGTATPLSNDASIFSYPKPNRQNRMPSPEEAAAVDMLAASANGRGVVDVPTAHGFCMYIRSACLEDTGVFREDLFGQGYAEENDFSRRASVLGWRHVAAPGIYVAHVGSQSFSQTKAALIERNLEILNRLHLGYDGLIQDWLKADPLLASRRQIDLLRLSSLVADRRAVLLVTHDREGGVMKHVRDRSAEYAQRDIVPFVLVPVSGDGGKKVTRLLTATETDYPNITFCDRETWDHLRDVLPALHVDRIEAHHFIGHGAGLFDQLPELGIPFDVYLHDYSWFCPRITLTNKANVFCGEPAVPACVVCVSEHGSQLGETIGPVALRERSTAFFRKAARIVAPSLDAAARFRRQLGVDVQTRDWEAHPQMPARGPTPVTGKVRVCVVGAISLEKGFDCLRQCAQIASVRHLPIEFIVVGYTCDDRALLDTGCVTITGRYRESEAVSLIRAQQAHFAFLPAVWPETWSYVLTELWEASLPVVAYDIGAPAERIRAHGHGLLIPLQLQPEALVNLFLRPGLFRDMPAIEARSSYHDLRNSH